MMINKIMDMLIGLTLLVGITACSQILPTPARPAPQEQMNMANPASVNCETQGGRLEIRTDASGGQVGFCVFPDGSECEEWAFFRKECQPGESQDLPAEPQPGMEYLNPAYGFALMLPEGWDIEEHPDQNYVKFNRRMDGGEYWLFVGYLRADEPLLPFRTGMPQGEMVPGEPFEMGGQVFVPQLLVWNGRTKVVQYGFNMAVDNLRLFVWLDAQDTGAGYEAIDLPATVMAEAVSILESLASAPE